MTLLSEAAYSRTMPAFLEGMPVKGRIRPSMDQPDTIHSVVISVSEHSFHLKYNFIFYGNFLYEVQGRFIIGINPEEQLTSIDISSTVRTKSDGVNEECQSERFFSFPRWKKVYRKNQREYVHLASVH